MCSGVLTQTVTCVHVLSITILCLQVISRLVTASGDDFIFLLSIFAKHFSHKEDDS